MKKKKERIEKKELKLLLENFTIIQKNLTELIVAFKKLEKRFDKFLDLVEQAAKEKIERKKIKEIGIEKKEKISEKNLSEKIEAILEQNKAMAEAIVLLEKLIKERLSEKEEI